MSENFNAVNISARIILKSSKCTFFSQQLDVMIVRGRLSHMMMESLCSVKNTYVAM